MEVILGARRQGKTTRIIRVAAENFSYIICSNRREVLRIANQAREMGLEIPFPITMDEYMDGLFYGRGIKSFVIDNAELILQRFTKNVPIVAISINGKVKEVL